MGIYIFLAVFLTGLGVVLSRYEAKRTKQKRRERLRQRARRCIRFDN